MTDEDCVKQFLVEQEKLNEILLHEEIYWKQRAKIFWLKKGDANTKKFHTSASSRRKSTYLKYLETEEGQRVEKLSEMGEVVIRYFEGIFMEPENRALPTSTECPRRVTHEQNKRLTEEVSFEEFTIALKQMHPDKASGPDGLNPAFYQNFWKLMGGEVFECCRTWLRDCTFPAELNSTNVVLIPKIEQACRMKDLRPIALCNVLYKIIAKVLSNRLRVLLPSLVSENQSAFVAGRSITDNVVVAFEIIHHM